MSKYSTHIHPDAPDLVVLSRRILAWTVRIELLHGSSSPVSVVVGHLSVPLDRVELLPLAQIELAVQSHFGFEVGERGHGEASDLQAVATVGEEK